METTHTTTHETTPRGAVVNALAVIGFIALILLGMGLAIYAARFIPTALSGLGEAAVSLSSIFGPGGNSIEVVDDGSYPNNSGVVVTLPIGTSTPTDTVPAPTTSAPPSYTPPSTGGSYYVPPTSSTGVVTLPIGGGTNTIGYSGNPDLVVEILAIGYVTRDRDGSTFRESSRVPRGEQGAVRFRIMNRGTNVSGAFEYEVKVKNDDRRTDTATGKAYSLAPGQAIVPLYAFFDARESGDAEVTITVDSDDDVRESNERNNEDSEDIDVRD